MSFPNTMREFQNDEWAKQLNVWIVETLKKMKIVTFNDIKDVVGKYLIPKFEEFDLMVRWVESQVVVTVYID